MKKLDQFLYCILTLKSSPCIRYNFTVLHILLIKGNYSLVFLKMMTMDLFIDVYSQIIFFYTNEVKHMYFSLIFFFLPAIHLGFLSRSVYLNLPHSFWWLDFIPWDGYMILKQSTIDRHLATVNNAVVNIIKCIFLCTGVFI